MKLVRDTQSNEIQRFEIGTALNACHFYTINIDVALETREHERPYLVEHQLFVMRKKM